MIILFILGALNLVNIFCLFWIVARIVRRRRVAFAATLGPVMGSLGLVALFGSKCPVKYLMHVLVGSFLSAILWDSRKFNIDSFRWISLVLLRFFYITSVASVMGCICYSPSIFHPILTTLVCFTSLVISEVLYNLDKRIGPAQPTRYPLLTTTHTSRAPSSVQLETVRIN
jgi:hypothetical protein